MSVLTPYAATGSYTGIGEGFAVTGHVYQLSVMGH